MIPSEKEKNSLCTKQTKKSVRIYEQETELQAGAHKRQVSGAVLEERSWRLP